MQNFISKTIKILETSSSIFSLAALFAIFALPVVLSFSISNSINVSDYSSLEVPSVVWIDNTNANDINNNSNNVLGVFTQRSVMLSDLIILNDKLFEIMPKISEKLDTRSYNLLFEYKGKLNQQQLLSIKNIYNDSITISFNFSFETLNNNTEKNVLRKLTIGDKEFLLNKSNEVLSYTFTLKSQEDINIYLDLSNTTDSKYKLVLLVD